MSSTNKERKKSFSLVILYELRIERTARGILWVARFASFVCSIDDYSKLKTSRQIRYLFAILLTLSKDSGGRSVAV